MTNRVAVGLAMPLIVAVTTLWTAAGQQRGLKVPPRETPSAPKAAASQPASQGGDMLALLRELKPLQKVHYSFPVPDRWLESPEHSIAREYVRITHAISFRGEAVTGAQVDVAVAICAAVNAEKPNPQASIGINYSPWHRQFGKDLPPTDNGPTAQAELGDQRERMANMRAWIDASNRRLKSDVRVTALLFDCERFQVKSAGQPGAAEWNAAIREKLTESVRIGKAAFPGASVVWYGQGAVQLCNRDDGWCEDAYMPVDVPGDAFCVSLYRVPELGDVREEFRRTVEHARRCGKDAVVPWVALGCGWRRAVDGPAWAWTFDWDYELVYSWSLGREINMPWYAQHSQRFAPWDAAKFVVFYPNPFDVRVPAGPRHFVAYVRGPNDVKRLPE